MGEAAHVLPTVADTLEGDVQEALKICGGDSMTALRITLIANAFLEAQIDELKEQISAGYARGRTRKPKDKPEETTEKH
jgi:hypothetical protein